MKKENYSLAYELDDMSVANPAFSEAIGDLEALRENYPDFKVTFFTVPWEVRYGVKGHLTNPEHGNKLRVMKMMDWAQYAVHGLTHLPSEFGNLDYDEAKKRIMLAEKIFTEASLPFVKIFKAPNWALSSDAKRAIQDMGYKVVEDGYYQWNLKDDMPKKQEFKGTMIAHGHLQNGDGCDNGVCETIHKLRKLPEGVEFKFISEVI